jgi:hypothetical protein
MIHQNGCIMLLQQFPVCIEWPLNLEFDSDVYFLGSEEISESIAIRVRPARASKCPRCWTFTRRDGDVLCQRCDEVVN